MELDAQKKREQELEKRLRTPKAVISREKFSEADTIETNSLIQTFVAGKFYLYESQHDRNSAPTEIDRSELEEIYNREQAITELKDILKGWIVSVAKQTGMEESLAKDEEVRIFTFGSHRLGVNSRGGDIDTVVLCPIYVDRDVHFFDQLFTLLEQEIHAAELIKVNDSKVLVPLIMMTFRGIPVDLAFAKLDVPKIDKKMRNLNDNNLLAACVDEKMVYSMNGPRNVDMIIQSVDPKEDPVRIGNFRTALRLLKLWAKNRGIYSNATGYITGISLAILVAKICQLFPNLKPNKLIQKFFIFYSVWSWDEFPVKIDEIRTYDNMERFNEMQWYDPKSEIGEEKIAQQKKDHFTSPMMVITPAFPVMNATRKVSKTNLNVMKEQLAIGKEIVQNKPVDWKKLFERVDFFNEYYNFIEVSILANDESEYRKWRGLVESQIIVLTKGLENKIEYDDHPRKLQLRPYPVDFDVPDKDFKYCICYYYGLKFQKPPADGGKDPAYLEFYDVAYDFIGKMAQRKQEGKYRTANLRILHLTRDQLPRALFEERAPEPKEETQLGKRPMDQSQTEQDNEFEPVLIKKVLQKEDLESKSTHFSNSATSSPTESSANVPIAVNQNIKNVPAPPVTQASVLKPAEVVNRVEPKVAPPQQQQTIQIATAKPEVKVTKPPVKPATSVPFVGKTSFKAIDTSSLLKQSNELDDFL